MLLQRASLQSHLISSLLPSGTHTTQLWLSDMLSTVSTLTFCLNRDVTSEPEQTRKGAKYELFRAYIIGTFMWL